MEQFEDYHQVGADSAKCIPAQASSLRKGGYVVIKDHACKIMNMSSSKVGKHGHAKIHLVGLDVFDSKKYEANCPSSHNVSVPLVDRQEMEITYLSQDGYFSLMTDTCTIKSDIKYNPDLCEQSLGHILKLWDECQENNDFVCMAQVWTCMDREEIKEVRKVKYNTK